jgi:uncharacterized protein YutE (UPF0331/DUF86 family)
MAELPESILAEQENVETALNNLQEVLHTGRKSVIELAATATFLHNIYTGIENILKQVFISRSLAVPKSDTWHQDLLKRSTAAGFISSGLAQELKDYLGFRHFFVHGYGFMLEEEKLEDLAAQLPGVWSKFMSEIERCFSNRSESAGS